jgi:anthranilate phosphoribosyltransferase
MKEILSFLFDHKTLTRDDAKQVLSNIASGKYNDPEIAAFVSVYLMRAITVEELAGFRDALLDLCIPVDLTDFNTIDVCGTGGDGKNTFNISTLTSFVVAGAGEKVAKHGNVSVSSNCGSSNVMEYYGYQFSSDNDKLRREMDLTGITFLHAPLFNPAMKNVAPVRKSLRMKTFFNMLGPMVNPSSPGNQLVGVFSLEVARLYNYIYQDSRINFTIIHSLDGYDEISLTGPFKAYTDAWERTIQPEEIGLSKLEPRQIHGGDTVEEASKIFINILEGKGTIAQNQAVIANTAFALLTMDRKLSMEDAVGKAEESLRSGRGLNAFKKLIELQ